jgi:RHS repeat-associated protein
VTQVTGTRPEEQWGYRYDRFHRLISAEGAASEVFRYDLAGNLLESHAGAYTYPPPGSPQPHTPASVGGMRFLYDANGNLLDGNGRSLTWDAHDRPRTVDNATVVYDGVGRRLSLSGGHSITRWPVGDDYEVQDGMPTIYVSGPRGLLARQSAGQKVWLHTDRLGSVHVVTSESGEVVKWRSYRPYGEVLAEAGNDQESRGFTGARRDLSGLHHLGARSYDPGLGLFASADPSDPTEAGVGTNRYAYTAGNPTNATDPTGLRWDCRVSEQQDGKGSTIVTVTCHYVPDRSGSAGSTGGGSGGRGGGNGRGGGGRGGGRGQAPTPPKEPTLPSEPSQPSDPSDPSDPGTTDNPSSMSVDENGNVTRTEYVEVEGITPVSQSYIEVDFVAGNGVNFLPGPVKGALRPAMGRFGDVDGDIYPEVMRNVYLGFMAVCKDKRLACHSKFHDRSRRRYQ